MNPKVIIGCEAFPLYAKFDFGELIGLLGALAKLTLHWSKLRC